MLRNLAVKVIFIAFFLWASQSSHAQGTIFVDGFESPLNISVSGPAFLAVGQQGSVVQELTGPVSSSGVSWTVEPAGLVDFDAGTGLIEGIAPGEVTLTASVTANTEDGPRELVDSVIVTVRRPAIKHQWTFNESANGFGRQFDDFLGGPSALVLNRPGGDPIVENGGVTLVGGNPDFTDFIWLQGDLFGGLKDTTIELWATQLSIQAWSRIFDFGSDTSNYLFMSWTRFGTLNSDRIEWRSPAGTWTKDDELGPYELGVEYHIAMVIDGDRGSNGEALVSWYRNGQRVGQTSMPPGFRLADLDCCNNFLGRSKYQADSVAHANYNEVRIYDGALSDDEILDSYNAGPLGGGQTVNISIGGTNQVNVGRTAQLTASITSNVGSFPGDVIWTSGNTELLTVSSTGRLTGEKMYRPGVQGCTVSVCEVAVTATVAAKPSVSTQVTVRIFPAVDPSETFRFTVNNLLRDVKDWTVSSSSWQGVTAPAGSRRGFGGHIQGIARAGAVWVMSHSQDNGEGFLIWGTGANNNWGYLEDGLGIEGHPGGIQASGDVIAVTAKPQGGSNNGGNGVKFFRFPISDTNTVIPLPHLTIGESRGEAGALAWNPRHGRFYFIDSRNQSVPSTGVADQPVWRTTKVGAPLTDPANRFEKYPLNGGVINLFGSQGSIQLMYDETTGEMYLLTFDRRTDDDVFFGTRENYFVSLVNFDAPELSNFFDTNTFVRTNADDSWYLFASPSFRWSAGLYIDAFGNARAISTERCVPQSVPGVCDSLQQDVDYWILGPSSP